MTHIYPKFLNRIQKVAGTYERRKNPVRLVEAEDQIQSNSNLEKAQEKMKINFPLEKWNQIELSLSRERKKNQQQGEELKTFSLQKTF